MKKNIISSLKVSLIINILCIVINLISIATFEFLPIGIGFGGGDCVVRSGFGLVTTKTYPEMPVYEPIESSTSLEFSFLSLLISFIIVFSIVLIFKKISSKKKQEVKS